MTLLFFDLRHFDLVLVLLRLNFLLPHHGLLGRLFFLSALLDQSHFVLITAIPLLVSPQI